MKKIDQKQRQYLNQQFENLENSSFQKYKLLQIKNTNNRLENHELTDFCQKVKKIYKKSVPESPEPSFRDLVKWIKANCGKEKEKEKEGRMNVTRMTADRTNTVEMPWTQSKIM